MPNFSSESLAYTSMAAERWRNSWRDRQYVEAGPAENASRGQAAVPSPLLAMQNSFVRMRSVILKQKEDKRKVSFGFWITILLMICLIGGLGTYIVYSYLPNSPFSVEGAAQPGAGQSPTLSIAGTNSTVFALGQTLRVSGTHFGPHDSIAFLLDTTIPITNSDGSPLGAQADSQGAFVVAITIANNWPTGDRIIQAVDASAHTSTYLNIHIIPAAKPVISSPDLRISLNGQPITTLAFTKQVGQADPPSQRITITNTSGAVLNWSASVTADQNLGWLMIEDHNTMGQLAISEPQTIGIGVNTVGLGVTPPGKPPYKGQVLFIINNSVVLTLPVQLTITDATSEMVFSPSPIIVMAKNGSCQAGTTLTLINLGAQIVSWTVNADDNQAIQFVNGSGMQVASGTLSPSGEDGDTIVLDLRCNGVHPGGEYHLSIYANATQASDTVLIQ